MREIVRNLGDFGEKLEQADRSRDYKEEFEETDSGGSDLYTDSSDEEDARIGGYLEEWNEFKR